MDLSVGSATSDSLQRDVLSSTRFGTQDSVQRVRFKIIEIARDRSWPLWQRLGAISLICDSLDRLSKANASLDSFSDALELPSALESYFIVAARSPSAPATQADVFRKLFAFQSIQLDKLSGYQRRAFEEVVTCFAEASQLEDSSRFIGVRYAAGLRVLNGFLATADHLMTNYVVNLMLDTMFPWEPAGDSFQERMYKLICRIGVLRFILALKAEGRGQSFSTEDFVSVVVAFTRFYEHNSRYKELVDDVFLGMRNVVNASPRAIIGLIRDDV